MFSNTKQIRKKKKEIEHILYIYVNKDKDNKFNQKILVRK
jgi:hypothetical protein